LLSFSAKSVAGSWPYLPIQERPAFLRFKRENPLGQASYWRAKDAFMTFPVPIELLAAMLDEHGGALELFAAQWTDSPEDCVQEAFVELARQPAPPRNPAAWLYRVVRNRAIGRARSAERRRRHERLAASLVPAWSNPADEPSVTGAELATALEALDESIREVIVARTWGGLSFEQIADVVGVSTSAAHRRYEAGLSALRQALGVVWNTSPRETRSTRRNPS
jgi:RNA polymerase sigma factor (sigma-70 family)